MDQAQFARLVGVDVRSVLRWEAGHAQPKGAAEAVLNGISESLHTAPNDADEIIQALLAAAAIGGLAYLLVKLLTKKE